MSFADHIRACNSFDRRRVVPLVAGPHRIGWLLRDSVEWLTQSHDAVAGLAPGARTARWRCAFQVADCTAAVSRALDHGATLVIAPTDMGIGSIAELLDPWGAPFAVTAPAHHQVELTLSFSAMAGMELTFGG